MLRQGAGDVPGSVCSLGDEELGRGCVSLPERLATATAQRLERIPLAHQMGHLRGRLATIGTALESAGLRFPIARDTTGSIHLGRTTRYVPGAGYAGAEGGP